MAITFGGLATGLDTNALIDGLMAIERLPLVRLQQKQSDLTSAKDTLSSFLSKIADIKKKAETLDSDSEFASYTATSDKDQVVVTVTGSALPGSYDVQVNKVALETRTKSSAFGSATTALGQTGNFDITVGGSAPVNISVAAGDSLTSIAAKINTSSARVTASIVNEGTQSRLLIRGDDTGSANQVVYDENGTSLGIDSVLNPTNTYQNAQDAEIEIDNQITVTRATNNFTDVIPGISITVTDVTGTPPVLEDPAKVTIAPDAEGQADKIQSFVDAYNLAVSAGHLASGFGSIKASNKNLQGDSAVRNALDRIAKTVSGKITGLTGKYDQLAAVGVKLKQDGTLTIDKTKLEQALEDDPAAVAKVFVGDPDTSTKGAMERLIEVVEDLAEGTDATLALRVDAFGDQIERLDDREIELERRLDDYEARLRKKFTDLEVLVSNIQKQGQGLLGFTGLSFGQK